MALLMRLPITLISLLVLCQGQQVPLKDDTRSLRGRFLHITDIHPDLLYQHNATLSSSCHRLPKPGEPDDGARRAGHWGAPRSACDSAVRFVNLTLDYLEENWADEIDFVIWTGDSARHDDDRQAPRTLDEIFMTNRMVAERMESIFTSRGIPVVPALGNNDIWPHNILEAGPSQITNTYADIWQTFIPFSSYQVFQRGAYYSTDLIPNQVGAISLNTLYFYAKNKVVDGCEYKDDEDPGNLQLDWMDVQLGLFRRRGMKVWIVGHVPPATDAYFPECYRRYLELSLRFQDTILGHLFGHLNVDFFFLLQADHLVTSPFEEILVQKKDRPHKALKKVFKSLPKVSKLDMDEWAVVNVAPSVVANPYLPAFRVFSYNVTGRAEGQATKKKHKHGGKRKGCNKKNEETWACREPHEEWHSDEGAPSRKNQLWTGLGYAQYWMPGLGNGTVEEEPEWELEYITHKVSALHPGKGEEIGSFVYPIPPRLLPRALQEGGKGGKRLAPYEMDDLTIGSWMGLARRLGREKEKWKQFKEFMYLS